MKMSAISGKHLEISLGGCGGEEGWGVEESVYQTSVLLASYKLILTENFWSQALKRRAKLSQDNCRMPAEVARPCSDSYNDLSLPVFLQKPALPHVTWLPDLGGAMS